MLELASREALMNILRPLGLLVIASSALAAADLPPAVVAQLLKIIAAGQSVHSTDPSVQGALSGHSVPKDPNANIVWVRAQAEVAEYAKQGKIVVCAKPEWAASGAALILTVENGKPAILLTASGAKDHSGKLPDSILKAAKRI